MSKSFIFSWIQSSYHLLGTTTPWLASSERLLAVVVVVVVVVVGVEVLVFEVDMMVLVCCSLLFLVVVVVVTYSRMLVFIRSSKTSSFMPIFVTIDPEKKCTKGKGRTWMFFIFIIFFTVASSFFSFLRLQFLDFHHQF
jgi:hypothetical protein